MLFGHTLSISQHVMHKARSHCCVFLQVEATVVSIREPTSDIRISKLTQPGIGLFPMISYIIGKSLESCDGYPSRCDLAVALTAEVSSLHSPRTGYYVNNFQVSCHMQDRKALDGANPCVAVNGCKTTVCTSPILLMSHTYVSGEGVGRHKESRILARAGEAAGNEQLH